MNDSNKNNRQGQGRLLWVDLEMTGLDPNVDKIVEVAAIATDFSMTEIATYQASIKVDKDFMAERMVGEFWDNHDASRQALLEGSSSDKSLAIATVEKELISFLQTNFDLSQPVYLAGNSIYNDRKFIEKEWPTLDKILHYRLLDVSAWKIVLMEKGLRFNKPEAHRALSDIKGSIEELKYYLKKGGF